ncbi:hypothetical protein F0415_05655 [Arenimonas fontis]|uniref:Uncharacterized protein n=2 Tax=Arenimonas fontis TaxID=2608255 RepID=A0A5B2Z9Z4_9GAMM|nr:hypothetical protein F0415_05655 [Arenimonas fontis]
MLAAALCPPAQAFARRPPSGDLVELQVRDLDSGRLLERHYHRGRWHLAGEPGQRYALVLRNLTGERVLAVLSVDGVNVVSGQTAAPSQSGYVLEPWQQIEVRGWRKSLEQVAEFHFTALPDSYAARTGRPENVGVIGMAVFRERRPAAVTPPPYYRRDGVAGAEDAAKAGAPAAGTREALAAPSHAPEARQALGTGHGQRRWDAARTTHFERASSRPEQVLSLYYDSYEALAARGVLPSRRPAWREPQAFPVGFVPDP